MNIRFNSFEEFKESITKSVLDGYERDNETYIIKCNHYKLKIKHFSNVFQTSNNLKKIINEWVIDKENARI